MTPPVLTKTDGQLAARCAATASLGAALIHFAVVPMHWRDWALSGLFFAVLALCQLLWAVLAWVRPTALLLAVGIVANVGVTALWVTSCVSGPPIGPSAGHPEAVGAAGISVALLQCYVVMGAAWAWSRVYQPDLVSGLGRTLVLVGANSVMVGAVAVGVVGGVHGAHHHGDAGDAHDVRQASLPERPAIGGTGNPSLPDPAEQGLPVTDMSLDIGEETPVLTPPADGHQHHHDD